MGHSKRGTAVVLLVNTGSNRWNGLVEKMLEIVLSAAEFGPVDLYCLGNIKVSDGVQGRVRVIPWHNRAAWLAYLLTGFQLAKSRYRVVAIPTLFHPFLPLLFVAAKLGGSIVVYRMGDPIKETVLRMPKMTRQRAKLPFLARLVTPLAGAAEWLVLKLSDHVLTVSPSLEREVRKRTRGTQQVHLSYNYVPVRPEPLTECEASLRQLRATVDTVCMYFGHAQPEIRGIEQLMEAMSRSNPRVGLAILGQRQGGPYFDQLAEAMCLEGRVVFLPPKPKQVALGYLEQADYAVIPVHPPYALPAKLFDAVACGVPLILPTTMTDAVELFGDISLLYDPADPDSLVRLLDGLTRTGGQAVRDQSEGRARLSMLPTFKQVVDGLMRSIWAEGSSGLLLDGDAQQGRCG